jgi:hypothetical protein
VRVDGEETVRRTVNRIEFNLPLDSALFTRPS